MPTHRVNSYLISLFFFGLISGINFSLVSFTIHYQLSQAGYTTDIIGVMFLTALPYSLKPVWAPFIDKYSIPILCQKFGQRRGWLLIAQISLLSAISGFLVIDPTDNIIITAILIFTISSCAGTQDIIVDAYRIERSKTKEDLSITATFSGAGFRSGLLVSSTGSLYLSCFFNWNFVYLCMFFIVMIGPIITLQLREAISRKLPQTSTDLISLTQYFQTMRDSLLLLKHKNPNWIFIMLFIFLYKASDSIPMAMSSPLFIDLSFSPQEIASISKAYGFVLMTIGGITGGILTTKIGLYRSILICGSFQLLSPLMLMFLSMVGHDILMFTITLTMQNFCCGLANTALVIYFSSLCSDKLVATQYSVISSFGSFVRIILSFLAGICAHYTTWSQLFLLTTLFSMLFIVVFLKVHNKF